MSQSLPPHQPCNRFLRSMRCEFALGSLVLCGLHRAPLAFITAHNVLNSNSQIALLGYVH